MNKFTCTSHWYPIISIEFFAQNADVSLVKPLQ